MVIKETILVNITAMFVIHFVVNFVKGDESCKTLFDLKAHNLNRRLIGHTISEFSVTSHHDCARECMSLLVCKSIDFHVKDKTCKLNDADSESVNYNEFDVKSGAVFSDITEWPTEMVNKCGSKPCTDSQRCVPVGYTFTCIESACSNIPVIKHGEINMVGNTVELKCKPGYYVDGDLNFLCQGAGQLKIPSCTKATDCLDVLKIKPFANSGVYDVKISETEQLISVYCDMDTEGRGWTVFQRRFNGSVDFYRTFDEYETGFGDMHAEFWLGLKKVQEMLYPGTSEVRIGVVTSGDRAEYVKYSEFQLVNGDLYELALDKTSLSGTVSNDSFGKAAGKFFSTKDRDHDSRSDINCAQTYHGAWWYYQCTRLNLNGFYEVPGTVSARYNGNGGIIHRDVDGHKVPKRN